LMSFSTSAGGERASLINDDSKMDRNLPMTETFKSSDRVQALGDALLTKGFVIQRCESESGLLELHSLIIDAANSWLLEHGHSPIDRLDESHRAISSDIINDVRLHIFARLNADVTLRQKYYSLASTAIQSLVGNDLAMQNKVNLSIQQPNDPTSVLDLHSDVWSGDSPFQVVLWVPLTDASSTNAMYLLPPNESHEAVRRSRDGEFESMEDIQRFYQSSFSSIEVKFGESLIFDSSCLHGNQLNTTNVSRWSLNCRFISLMAPAISPERRLGSYYTPILVRPATQMGLRAIAALGITLS